MTTCSNCYNGCAEKVADKCVMYTGVNIPLLDISTGDTLLFVEQQISTFLATVADGTGVIPTIDVAITICDLITQYIPIVDPITVNDWLGVLIKSICTLQAQVTAISGDLIAAEADIATIEASYTVSCLSGVIASSGTHAVIQAVITRLCALVTTLSTNYSANGTELNAQISAYLSANPPTSTAMKYRMVPYAVVEYYGSLSYFNGTGQGIPGTDWEDIYLCNGNNGTPDKRGRVAVGALDNVGGLPLDPTRAPGGFNPDYILNTPVGSNGVTLTTDMIPSHTHTTNYSQTTHSHFSFSDNVITGDSPWITNLTYPATRDELNEKSSYRIMGHQTGASVGKTSDATITTYITCNNTGGGLAHANIQPVFPCYYIQYRP